MEILRAIERADALCPNPYTLEEKLSWCDEVSAELRRNIIKVYDVIETEINSVGEVILPDDIPFERIELAFLGNCRIEKQDFRSFISGYTQKASVSGKVQPLRLVYLTIPEAIRFPDIRGEFNTGDNTIEIEGHPFAEGDKLEILVLQELDEAPKWETAETAYVMEAKPDMIILDRDALEAQTDAKLAIRRVIEDFTEIDEAPYDRMYIEYILAKIALYQHDYTSYNAHMTQYNGLYEALRKEYKTRNPLTTQAKFVNYSKL